MARVVVTEPADADTAEIQAYLEREAGSLTASKYSNSLLLPGFLIRITTIAGNRPIRRGRGSGLR